MNNNFNIIIKYHEIQYFYKTKAHFKNELYGLYKLKVFKNGPFTNF